MLSILKFGGSSLEGPQKIHRVAEIVKSHVDDGSQVIVVVSAMGKGTDQLINLALEISPECQSKHARELDMLISVGERISMSLVSMAIRDLGISSISLTGSQSGIITSDVHGDAEIIEIRPDRIKKSLTENSVVIVAGFQGIGTHKEITTLGRGGSDTTAVALKKYLKADIVKIYSDVDAYYSADPKLIPSAKRYEQMPWELGLLSSIYGARVLHYKAALLAAESQTPVHMLSTSNPQGKGGLLGGGVSQDNHKFQAFTLNLKKGLIKLTTKNNLGLDKRLNSDLKSKSKIFSSQFNHIPATTLGAELFFYFGEKILKLQEGKKIFSKEEEFWAISLVGIALDKQKTLLEQATELLKRHNLVLEGYTYNPFLLSLCFKAPSTQGEQKLLSDFHTSFVGT